MHHITSICRTKLFDEILFAIYHIDGNTIRIHTDGNALIMIITLHVNSYFIKSGTESMMNTACMSKSPSHQHTEYARRLAGMSFDLNWIFIEIWVTYVDLSTSNMTSKSAEEWLDRNFPNSSAQIDVCLGRVHFPRKTEFRRREA